MATATPKPAQLRALARLRLERLRQTPPESEEVQRLRAEGYVVLGGPQGYVILPPLRD